MNAAMPSKQPLLDIRNLQVDYLTERGPVRAVNGVSFSIAAGEVFGLAGESGCGKSTIAHAILRVLRPPAIITGGQILYKGVDVLQMEGTSLAEYQKKVLSTPERKAITPSSNLMETYRWAEVSMVFQSAMNSLNPVIKVVDQLTDVLMTHENIDRGQARQRAEELLNVVNIEKSRLDSYPHELSGGMRQRVVIAIALALKPALMIMDEPTTALDVVVQKDILQQIEKLKQEYGFSILFITHDLSLMVEFSDRLGIMYAAELVELASAKEILTHPLHPYTKGLLTSFPSITGPRTKLSGIPGSPPNLLDPPKGCRFHPRCPDWDGIVADTRPAWQELYPRHWVACRCAKENEGKTPAFNQMAEASRSGR
jgi:peptide/nickel transport system ATP-binding protein